MKKGFAMIPNELFETDTWDQADNIRFIKQH